MSLLNAADVGKKPKVWLLGAGHKHPLLGTAYLTFQNYQMKTSIISAVKVSSSQLTTFINAVKV